MRSEFSLIGGNVGERVIVFGVDMSLPVHIDKNKKDILIIGKGPTQRLDDTMLTAQAQYSIYFSGSNRKFCLRLHYNWINSFLLVSTTKMYQFKVKGNISGAFSANNTKEKNSIKRICI